ncbi:MAG: S8 family serine peptidase [candidate division WOR-3 bacterium]
MRIRVLALVAAAVMVVSAQGNWPDLLRPVVRSADGEEHLAGQLIIELKPEMRGRVSLNEKDGVALFGIPALDELNRKWGVKLIAPLWRRPTVDPIAMKYGCDLQYLIQFDVDQDITPVAADYERLAEVEYVCPNGYMRFDEVPNDPEYSRQWHFVNLGAPFAWGVAKGRTRVVNCVLDDGLDLFHPDIEANLWINAPEDVNGNGRFDTLPYPDGDLDGVDQDMNGYADDVVGWDFVTGDPIPMPYGTNEHGTHCWGITNAVTNNGVGVAGTTWNSRSMALRCGQEGGISIYAAIGAIYYLVPMNAWSISMSFGSSSPYQPMADACQYAWDSGLVLFGSAGNEGVEAMRYPACYNGVENVAASGRNDTKTSWSNYGTWVDVTAPGEGIYSTVPRLVGSYAALDGTSMSCPLAAGVACWIKSFDSTVSNATCIQMLHDACDSMPDPLYVQGKLGAGRVSMANVVLPQYYCNLKLTGWRFNDGGGNGRPDPGETVALIVTYTNSPGWRTATNVQATLGVLGTDVTIVKGTATFPDIPGGGSGSCSADSFVFQISPAAPPEMLRFFLTVSASPEPAYPDTSFTAQSGSPRVLIVDDDAGQNYERYYTSACDSNRLLYDVYSVQNAGSPSADTLRHYPVVIWFTGDARTNTLTPTDQANLASYLDNGGKLILSGQNIAYELNGSAFLSNYLKCEYVADSTGKPYLPGIAGDPLTRGDTMVTAGGGGANNARSSDAIRALGEAVACARYRDYPDTTAVPMIRYAGSYRLVFFAVAFEAIDHSNRYLQRWTLIRRIFDWFGERLPGVEQPLVATESRRPYALRITPNPFSSRALVEFTAPVTGGVELRVYSLSGQLVNRVSRQVSFGDYVRINVDAGAMTNGIYLFQLVTAEGVYAQKAAVLR